MIIQNALGETEFEPGQYEVGGYLIDISEDFDGMGVMISDPLTGGESLVEIPYY